MLCSPSWKATVLERGISHSSGRLDLEEEEEEEAECGDMAPGRR